MTDDQRAVDVLIRENRRAAVKDWSWFTFDALFGVWLALHGPNWMTAAFMVSLASRILAANRLAYWSKVKEALGE